MTRNVEMGMNEVKVVKQEEKIRAMVENIYDMQKLRIACGNRIVASFTDLGEKSRNRTSESVKEELDNKTEDDTDKKIKCIMAEYQRITDDYVQTITDRRLTDSRIEKAIAEAQKGKALEFIGTVYEYRMAENYKSMLKTEEQAVQALATEVKRHPMWARFFDGVTGCGPMMAAVCISYFDIHKAKYPSSFWKYAGLDVVNGEGRGRVHTEQREYIDKNGDIQLKNGITFNPKLKTKLLGVLAPCIIKLSREKKEAGSTESGKPIGYAKMYYDYKDKLDHRVDYCEQIYNMLEPLNDGTAKVVTDPSLIKEVSAIWKVYRYKSVDKVEFKRGDKGIFVQLTADDGTTANVYGKSLTPAHKHNMATRYMIKQFVRDLWIVWREYEGYDIGNPYYERARMPKRA